MILFYDYNIFHLFKLDYNNTTEVLRKSYGFSGMIDGLYGIVTGNIIKY